MKKVTGIGGIFFKCKDKDAQISWYEQHLGIENGGYGANFEWRELDAPEKKGTTVFSPFAETTNYFEPSQKEFMINYRVADLEALVKELEQAGVSLVGELQVYPYGKFAHIMDPEGNKIELWEDTGDQDETAAE